MRNAKQGKRPDVLKAASLSALRELQRRQAKQRQDTAAVPKAQLAAPSAHAVPVKRSSAATGASMQPRPGLDASDIALFRRVVAGVVPAPQHDERVLSGPVHVATVAQMQQRRQHAMGLNPVELPRVSDMFAPAATHDDDSVFLRAGHGPHLTKGLRKGKWPVQASLDLHGATLDAARLRLDQFLQSCRDHSMRCVRIVHGKGYGSRDGDPVLKQTVRRWLTQMADVLAYVECAENEGGAGAVNVLLRKARP